MKTGSVFCNIYWVKIVELNIPEKEQIMDTSAMKKVKFTNIVNIISVITSLLYVLLSVAYFVAMGNTLINGNEYEMLGFIFGLIGLPIVIVFMI